MSCDTIVQMIEKCLCEKDMHVAISFDMPPGYETAYGTYDPLLQTLFLNPQLVRSGEPYEAAYYLFHELRHAMQYANPEKFDVFIRKSLPYVILYDGSCFKLSDTKWLECRLSGEQDYFLRAYQNLPYEVDANRYAYEQTVKLFPDHQEALRELLNFWLPKEAFSTEEYDRLFARIERNVL